jgi:hypothetical protein
MAVAATPLYIEGTIPRILDVWPIRPAATSMAKYCDGILCCGRNMLWILDAVFDKFWPLPDNLVDHSTLTRLVKVLNYICTALYDLAARVMSPPFLQYFDHAAYFDRMYEVLDVYYHSLQAFGDIPYGWDCPDGNFQDSRILDMPTENPFELLIQLAYQRRVHDTQETNITPRTCQLVCTLFLSASIPEQISTNNIVEQVQDMVRVLTDAHFPRNPDQKDDLQGMPRVIFVCTSHPNRIITASTMVVMSDFGGIGDPWTVLRRARFVNPEAHRTAAQQIIYTTAHWPTPPQDYAAATAALIAAGNPAPDNPARSARTLQDIHARVTPPPPTGPWAEWTGWDHLLGSSRSFWVVGDIPKVPNPGPPNYFNNVARCLKCRLLNLYNVDAENLLENANANQACQCAEDICHVLCERVGPART